jgi:4-amino-4-deoxy-L-arabinose transferase-like glycosyltransferase
MQKRETIFFIILFILGFIYRFLLSSVTITQIQFDALTYHNFALTMQSGKFVADCCFKNLGYSAFLALVYNIFGSNNLIAIRVIQIILDELVAVFVYLIAAKLISRKTAFFAYVLYLSNPITSSFTGLRLSEVLSIFCVALCTWIITLSGFKTKWWNWLLWGLSLGILAFVRQHFVIFSVVMIVILGLIQFRKLIRVYFIAICLVGFGIGSAYTIAANYVNFHIVALSPPYIRSWGLGVYTESVLNWKIPELSSELDYAFAQNDFVEVALEYEHAQPKQVPELEAKYKKLFLAQLQENPSRILRNVSQNLLWLWDKYHLSESVDVYYPTDKIPVRIYNIIALSLCMFGWGAYLAKDWRRSYRNPFCVFVLALFGFMTVPFAVVANESRYTFPFYPFVFLWAANGLVILENLWRNLKSKFMG